ncbi:MAG TPA: flagellar export chaperone FliS [Spirochaetales bacterium]|nr:flagellar export chaperone FliS [Spirochaetales bacterium]HRY55578.1 flagellar export chaperone FliS [Spirochaetia bacterium]
MNANPLAAYRETRVKTASPGQLVVMLYDEALKQCDKAIELAGEGAKPKPEHIERINAALGKAQDVITELMASLDFDAGGEIAQNLFSLYVWFGRELLEANIAKDTARVKSVRGMLAELRVAWAEVALKAQGGSASSVGVNIAG